MDHATDLGARIVRLLRAYDGRGHTVEPLVQNPVVNVLDVWCNDGTHFIVTVVKNA